MSGIERARNTRETGLGGASAAVVASPPPAASNAVPATGHVTVTVNTPPTVKSCGGDEKEPPNQSPATDKAVGTGATAVDTISIPLVLGLNSTSDKPTAAAVVTGGVKPKAAAAAGVKGSVGGCDDVSAAAAAADDFELVPVLYCTHLLSFSGSSHYIALVWFVCSLPDLQATQTTTSANAL